jgi:hypothetical protein
MRQVVTVSAVLLLALLSLSLFANATNWATQNIDDDYEMGCRYVSQIALDSHDRPHLAFTRICPKDEWGRIIMFDVIYASYNGSGWEKQRLGFGEVLSLALDSNDNPHILYNGFGNITGLMCSKWTGSSWETVTVDPQYATCASFVLDKSGNPHIVYTINNYYSSPYIIKYAVLTKSGFNTQTISPSETSVGSVSVCLGSDDKPQILYDTKLDLHSDPLTIKYLIYENSCWITQTLSYKVYIHSGVVLDSHNQPHFIFFDGRQLKYASCNDSIWSAQTITDDTTGSGYLCLDSHDNPQISFVNGEWPGSLMYGKWSGQEWIFQNITVLPYSQGSGPIVTDSKDNPHIVYATYRSSYSQYCWYATSDQSAADPSPSPSPSPSFPSEIIIAAVILVSLLFSGLIYALNILRKR